MELAEKQLIIDWKGKRGKSGQKRGKSKKGKQVRKKTWLSNEVKIEKEETYMKQRGGEKSKKNVCKEGERKKRYRRRKKDKRKKEDDKTIRWEQR